MISTKEKGITLIALIITIIVMLILVAVTVNVALNGGLLNQAQKAKYQTEVSVIKDYVTEKTATLLAENQNNDAFKGLTSLEQLDMDQELKDKYKDKLVISEGKLYYKPEIVTNEEERQWLEQIDVYPYEGGSIDSDAPKATLKVGDYIAYPSVGERSAYVDRREHGATIGDGSGTGWGTYTAEISTTNGGWRVLKIDGDKITLISATASTPGNSVHGEVILKREQVYNNGVEILNRVCDTQYTIDGYGKARCMNLEDIYNAIGREMPELATSTLNSTFEAEYTTHDNGYYPSRLAEEIGVEIDSVSTGGDLSKSAPGESMYLNNETINSVVQGSEQSNTGLDLGNTYKKYEKTLKLQYTDAWVTDVNKAIKEITDPTLKEIILGKNETRTWWIATRCIATGSWWGNKTAGFGMMQMRNSTSVSSEYNYGSQSDSGNNACDYKYGNTVGQIAGWFRPVIELDTSKTIDTTITDTTDGSFEHPWKIVNK